MSAVTDHTILADHMRGGIYLSAVLAVYSRRRGALVVPTTAIFGAFAEAAPATTRAQHARAAYDRLQWVVGADAGAVVKVQSYELPEALQVARDVPVPADAGAAAYLLAAPVVWAARRLGMPVLTLQPKLYEAYDVPTRTTP